MDRLELAFFVSCHLCMAVSLTWVFRAISNVVEMEETPQPRQQLRCFQLQHYSTNPGFVTSMKCGFHVLQSAVLHVRYLDTHQHVLGSTWKLSNVRGNCSQRRHQDGLVATFGNVFFLHKAVISLQISVVSPKAGESPTTEAPGFSHFREPSLWDDTCERWRRLCQTYRP